MYIRCDESSLYSGLTISTALTGNFSAGVRNIKTCTQGLARTRMHYANAPVLDLEETGRYDLAWKICVVF